MNVRVGGKLFNRRNKQDLPSTAANNGGREIEGTARLGSGTGLCSKLLGQARGDLAAAAVAGLCNSTEEGHLVAVSSVCCLPHSRQLVAFYMCTRMRSSVASLGRTLPACVFKDRDLHKCPRRGEGGTCPRSSFELSKRPERFPTCFSKILRASRDEDLGRFVKS